MKFRFVMMLAEWYCVEGKPTTRESHLERPRLMADGCQIFVPFILNPSEAFFSVVCLVSLFKKTKLNN